MNPEPLLVVSETIVELAKYALIAYLGRASLDYLKYRLEVLGKDATIFVRRTGTDSQEHKLDAARFDSATTPAEQIEPKMKLTTVNEPYDIEDLTHLIDPEYDPEKEHAKNRRAADETSERMKQTYRRTPGPLELEI